MRPSMPYRPNGRIHIALEDSICALFSRERVSFAHVEEIRDDP